MLNGAKFRDSFLKRVLCTSNVLSSQPGSLAALKLKHCALETKRKGGGGKEA